MREYKFRAWDGKNLHYYSSDIIFEIYNDEDIQQFTGLKDRNGKEIYEGDFVESDVYRVNGVVEYSGISIRPFLYYMNPEEDFEVLGNIYENPELLERN